MRRLILTIFILAFATRAFASKEGILPLSAFRLESDGIGKSGKVVVEGKGDEDGHIISLKVTAFGREHVIPKEKLAELRGLMTNGVRITYDAGYAEVGGRTVYVDLQMGFPSGTRGQRYIAVKENGTIEIGKPQIDKN
jgi:hypothetical protein